MTEQLQEMKQNMTVNRGPNQDLPPGQICGLLRDLKQEGSSWVHGRPLRTWSLASRYVTMLTLSNAMLSGTQIWSIRSENTDGPSANTPRPGHTASCALLTCLLTDAPGFMILPGPRA